MTNIFFNIIFSIIYRVPICKKISVGCIKFSLRNKLLLSWLNYTYRQFNPINIIKFYNLYAGIFKNGEPKICDRKWIIKFLNKKIILPLRSDQLWLDWDTALSVLAHDAEIKQTYEFLIAKCNISCFIDIGSNYGTHSLLFLSQNIKTLSIEPNPNCNNYFIQSCLLNNFKNDLLNVAIGHSEASRILYFPEKETWLGSIHNNITDQNNICQIDVQMLALDKIVEEKNISPDLIKIDTEGNELNIINGAVNTIIKYKPFIIFESNRGEPRKGLVVKLKSLGYCIAKLPMNNLPDAFIYKNDEFLNSTNTNFIAFSNKIRENR